MQQEKAQSSVDLDVTAKIDAVKISSTEFYKAGFCELEGYYRKYDYRISGSSKEKMYERACQFIHEVTGQKIGIAYEPTNAWMPQVVVTIAPPDQTGMRRLELERILALLPNYRFLKLELAHDFNRDSIVSLAFARKHLVIGKSHRSENGSHDDVLHFGARKSPVFARCYDKPSINCFRIEVEFHSEWLRKHHISTTDDFVRLPALVARTYIAFFKIDPLKLTAALQRLGAPVDSVFRKLISRQDDLAVALRYLRKHVGLTNANRILVPLKTNSRVEKALQLWARDWARQGGAAAGDE